MTRCRALVTLVVVLPFVAFAKPPQLLGYQGRLLKTDGSPAPGPVQLKFGLYDVETGGAALATETQTLGLDNGYYSTFIGQTAGSAFEAGLAAGTGYLQLSVAPVGSTTFEDLSPRQRIGSVAYALYSTNQSGGTVNATSVAVNGTTIVDGNGRLTSSLSSNACTSGQVLQWNGTAWVCATVMSSGGGNATSLQSVPISMAAPTNGQILSYNGAQWLPAAPPTPTTLQGTPVSMTAPTNGQVLVFNGTSWVPTTQPSQIITSDLTLNVPSPFADVNAALASLDGKRIASPAAVTIQVANGMYNYNASINVKHPDGDRIFIVGNTTTPSNVRLTFTTNVNGVLVLGGNRLGGFNGFRIVNSLASNATVGVNVSNGSTATVGPALEISGFQIGLESSYSSSIIANSVAVLSCGGAPATGAGMEAYGSSSVTAVSASVNGCFYGYLSESSSNMTVQSSKATNIANLGYLSEFSSTMYAPFVTAQTVNGWCYYAVYGSSLFVQQSTTSGCTAGGYLSQWNSTVDAHGSSISGAPTCYQADYSSTINAITATPCVGATIPPANTPGATFGYVLQ